MGKLWIYDILNTRISSDILQPPNKLVGGLYLLLVPQPNHLSKLFKFEDSIAMVYFYLISRANYTKYAKTQWVSTQKFARCKQARRIFPVYTRREKLLRLIFQSRAQLYNKEKSVHRIVFWSKEDKLLKSVQCARFAHGIQILKIVNSAHN